MFIKISYAIIGIVFLVCFNQSSAQKIRNENGVKVVENGKEILWGNNPQIKLEYEGKFGNHDDNDQTTWFSKPADIAFDQEGNIYVLDVMDCCVRKYNRSRKYLFSFGRKGRGPGELVWPDKISVSPNGKIYVSDKLQQRVNIYSKDGKSAGTIKIKYHHFPFIMVSNENMIVGNPLLTGAGALNEPIFFFMDIQGKKIKTFGEGPYSKADKTKRDKTLAAGNQLTFAVDNNLNTYAAFFLVNRIDKFDKNGKLILRILNNDRPFSKNYGIAVDSKDRIWVLTRQRYSKEEEKSGVKRAMFDDNGVSGVEYYGNKALVKTDMYAIELFDKEGRLLYKYPLHHFISGENMDPAAFKIKINKNEIYIMEDFRESTFHVYKISDL